MMSKTKYLSILWLCFILKHDLGAQVVPPPATQTEVNAGVNRFKYLTPYTFANSTVAAATAAGKQHGSFILTNFIAMGITNIVSANGNTVITTNSGVLTLTTSAGAAGTNFAGTVITNLGNHLGHVNVGTNLYVTNSINLIGDGTIAGEVQLFGTNSIAVVTKAANSNSVAITNIIGLLHKASAATIVLDCNHGNNFQITNQLGQATSVIVTNLAQGQNITISGDADGTSRVLTIIPHLGFLVRDFDAFGVAAAANKAITVTNGNTFEVSIYAKWSFATNFADVVTRQAKY